MVDKSTGLKKSLNYGANEHKKIMEFFYNDSLDSKIKFNDLTLKEKTFTNILAYIFEKFQK